MVPFALLIGVEDRRFIAAAKEKAAKTGHFLLQVGPVWPNNATILQAIDLMWPQPNIVLIEATNHLDDCIAFMEKLRGAPGSSPETLFFPYSRNNLLSEWKRLREAGATSFTYTGGPSIQGSLNLIFSHDPQKAIA